MIWKCFRSLWNNHSTYQSKLNQSRIRTRSQTPDRSICLFCAIIFGITSSLALPWSLNIPLKGKVNSFPLPKIGPFNVFVFLTWDFFLISVFEKKCCYSALFRWDLYPTYIRRKICGSHLTAIFNKFIQLTISEKSLIMSSCPHFLNLSPVRPVSF